jgi:hypothetical protein
MIFLIKACAITLNKEVRFGGASAAVPPLIGRSFPQTSGAIERLVSAEVLSQVRVGRRNRVFEAPAIINAFTDLERQLASPAGDTRASEPVRPVPPHRPRRSNPIPPNE